MEDTLRVGVNARTFSVDEPGGAVQAAVQMVRALAARDDTEVVLFGHPDTQQHFPDLPLDSTGYVVDSQLYGAVWERAILPRRASLANVDLLLAPNGNGPIHETPYPTVVWVHDVNAIRGHSAGVHRLYRRATVPRAVAAADAVTTISQFSKEEIIKHLPVEESDVHVIHNGLAEPYLDAARAGPATQQSASALVADGGEPSHDGVAAELPDRYVLFVGSLNPRKNVARLVEAFARLKRETGLPHELVMAGPSPKRIFQQLDVDAATERDAAITSVGFVSDAELRGLYRGADCFAFPSLYEGFGLPPLEAMAMGTPVVTSSVSSLPEVCGNAAVLVNPYDVGAIRNGIEEVLTDERLAEGLVTDGRTQVRRYTWERAARQFVRVGTELVKAN
ncbi:glycosyltransferase family 4 protein (plasmid) [Salinirubellus salinus]|uniref:Glycosyltransferase family 4 protein n=1 Tax=Salinirubellus salinus TaxID=1364945 RepID=A0A9E7U6Z7_9EURY|nr:glycosyltransferase family 1 protein [Salinirubellus salinus]UWM56955.1 glycosyltransferase family 4 protein [Salinirubellus salinus]